MQIPPAIEPTNLDTPELLSMSPVEVPPDRSPTLEDERNETNERCNRARDSENLKARLVFNYDYSLIVALYQVASPLEIAIDL